MGIYARIEGKIYKAVSHHKNKQLAERNASQYRQRYSGECSYRVTLASAHPESRTNYKAGYVVWVNRK